MISPHTIQQISNRIDIVEIVGGFVKLKKRGSNYLGLCPFHSEKTPSFIVSPGKEIYKCFGCGKSGNSITFLMEHEKYSYVEALRWLAAKYNVEIEETGVSPEAKLQHQVADSLYIINNFAQQFFSEQLFNTEQGQAVGLSYLKERGFREETIRKFQLGYSPFERDVFAKAAIAAKYTTELLQKTGLVVIRDGAAIDNYRNRIIFPVHNQSGKVQGFGARVIGRNDKAPKYINTPENEIYLKSRILYGLYFARQAVDKSDECLLVEGYTDVISLHQAGIENVVASGGTSLTPDQLRLIKKYTKNLTIIYDGDAAGIKAALRGLTLALEEGLNVNLVLIPDNEDPDSYVNKIGASAFSNFIQSNKKDFILFQLELFLREAGNDSNKKAALVNQIAETISRMNKVEDFTKQQDYIRRCAELLQVDESGFNSLVNKFIRDKIAKQENQAQPTESFQQPESVDIPEQDETTLLLQRDEPFERALVRCLLEFGLKSWSDNRRVADHILEEINDQHLIEDEQLLRIVEMYKVWLQEGLEPTPRNFLYHEDQELNKYVIGLMDFPYELSANWKEHFEGKIATREDLYKEEIISTINYLKLRKIKRMVDENQRDLQRSTNPEEQIVFMQTHHHLKVMEMELLQQIGTVIIK
jgi:DNA primase